ncbi:phosphonate metabolism transcriptional regulator PhnF [Virgibacillus pantothenticus]|uniref:Transcriptional regulator n=1 Tax=Virgibacillus pantothenticus TaxID=1473 RepID=A0A0L0QRX4_VIRPA|nr:MULTISPECIES: GntR family transcriptional regulator [Virgibacillus]API92062.1 transcriptional regulator [Virgibacillus sp. 6R]KNE21317.1 transcriptional regulator [Virgibacillus pantothenticus]MBS7430531.1 GntR family transcriptional regulator [Virgibacillus sp. 19R1-5]MBU8566469.1 GntR family transcriptional regulator [Virgibacillus pantothenticus]MBU8600116.1 GntR family transcriptional regulator [Virgibacillus pantothenticus]
MPVDKEMQIIDDIMEKIITKAMKPGEKIPSENKLADQHKVPRITARKALTTLEARGYIYSVQGKGRFLKETSKPIQLHLTGNSSFTDKMKRAGYRLTTKNMYCNKINYDSKIYDTLQANREAAIYKIGRLRLIDDEPIAIHQSFVDQDRFPNIAHEGSQILSMFAYYRQFGYEEFASKHSLLSITFPTSYEQELLSCSSMVPLIVLETDCIDRKTKKVLEYTKILYRSDKFKYDITSEGSR